MSRACWILLALAGCSAAPAAPPRAAAPTAPTAPAPAVVYARGESFGDERSPSGLARRGGARYFARSLRAEVRGGDVAFSDDRAAEPVADAVEVAGGRWAFFSYGGAVTVSDGFLGALRPLGHVPAGAVTNPWSRGRATSVRGGRLWLTDGASLAEAQVPGAPVVAAAFASESAGAVVHRDGSLSATDDGGRTWRAVDLRGELALAVEFDGDSLRVATTRGPMSLSAGALAPAPAALALDDAAERVAAVHRARVALALREREGTANGTALTLPAGARVELDDGILTWRPPGGEASVGRVSSNPCDALAPWGEGFAVQCGRLLRGDASGRLFRVELPPEARDAEAVLSDDGVHAARDGACPAPRDPDVTEQDRFRAEQEGADEGAPQPPSVCVLDDGRGRWRTVPLPALEESWRRWTVVGMRGTQLLLRVGDDDARWQVFDASTGRGRDVRAEPEMSIRSLAWLRDGSLVGVGRACDAPGDRCAASLLRGSPDAALHPTQLPEGATAVAFADASRGLARGETFGAAWRTTDGGATWDAVPVPEALRGARFPTFAPTSCDAAGCAVGGRLRVAGWGPMRPAEERVVAVDGAPPEVPDSRSNGASLELAPMTCTPARATTPSPWRLPGDGPRAVDGDGAWAFAREGDGRTRARWAGVRGRGEAVLPFDLPADNGLVGLWGGPGRALLARADTGALYLAAGGVARELAGPTLPVDDGGAGLRLASSDVAADGASLMLQSTGAVAHAAVDAVLTVDAAGAVARRYAVRADPSALSAGRIPTLALARRGGTWSRAVLSGDGVRVEGAGGDALLRAWSGSLRPCAGPAPAGAVTLRVIGCRAQAHCLSSSMLRGAEAEVAEVELAGDVVCVRALRASGRVEGDGRAPAPIAWNLRAVGGALAGFLDDGVRRAALRCAPSTDR